MTRTAATVHARDAFGNAAAHSKTDQERGTPAGENAPPRRRPEQHRPRPLLHALSGTVFGTELLIFTLKPENAHARHLHLRSVLAVVQRWREAILSKCNGLPAPVRELLSGHACDGSPLDRPHLAFLPLACAGHPRAADRLRGMALALPAGTASGDRCAAQRAIAEVRRLVLGPLGVWAVRPATAGAPSAALRPETWTAWPRGATQWSTVTPFVFDRHPKAKQGAQHRREVAALVTRACTTIGLPPPREVIVTQASLHAGVPPSSQFPRPRRKDGSERRHAHATLVFDAPVRGPIVIGAGRYRGYGVCRPLDIGGVGA